MIKNIQENLQKRTLKFVIFMMMFWSFTSVGKASDYIVSPGSKMSIITCTPGPDLYSLFGHTAIRFQDTVNGKYLDLVYNYGTFIFDEDFYVKFARGKLDYILNREKFGDFQQEYIATGRGIYEQQLLLTREERQILFDLLEENADPANRTYRYDFFYDNCATRIRDVIIRATSGKSQPDGLGFVYVSPDQINAANRINFSYVYPQEFTFRHAIQNYLQYQPWSDFGIDLALGIPCDRVMEKGQAMFLPDSLMRDFNYAIYQEQQLTSTAEEVLPQEYEPENLTVFTPLVVMSLVLVLHFIFVRLIEKRSQVGISTRIIFFLTGLLGIFVVFLWFFTDHQATKWNLNLIWANPLNLILAFVPAKLYSGFWLKWLKIYFYLMVAMLLLWFVLPQTMHPAIIPLTVALLISILKLIKPHYLGFKTKTL